VNVVRLWCLRCRLGEVVRSGNDTKAILLYTAIAIILLPFKNTFISVCLRSTTSSDVVECGFRLKSVAPKDAHSWSISTLDMHI
jgi:hypothetical protein